MDVKLGWGHFQNNLRRTGILLILENKDASKDGRIFKLKENKNKKPDMKAAVKRINDLVTNKKLLLLENKSGWNNSYLMKEYIISFLYSSLDIG